MRRPRRGDHLEPEIAPHPVIDMHHQIAGAERLRLGEVVLRPPPASRRADQPVAEDILLGDYREIRRDEAVLEPPDRRMQPVPADPRSVAHADRADHSLILQQALEPLPRSLRTGRQKHRTLP